MGFLIAALDVNQGQLRPLLEAISEILGDLSRCPSSVPYIHRGKEARRGSQEERGGRHFPQGAGSGPGDLGPTSRPAFVPVLSPSRACWEWGA